MKNKFIFITMVLMIAAFLGGCNQGTSTQQADNPQKANKTLEVYTTIFPIEDFTKKIGGKYVHVESVYPAGADAHTFEPTIKTMMKIADADLFIYNGAGLESFVDKTKKSLSKEKVVLIEASNGIELLSGDHNDHDEDGHEEHDHDHEHTHDDEGKTEESTHPNTEESHSDDHEDEHANEDSSDEHGEHDHDHHHDQDPHVWLDPIYAIKMAENIKDSLSEAMPSAKDEFEGNFQDLKEKLERIDKDLQETIGSSEHKELLVSHASYGYWEQRYGIEQISISGLSPEHEPSQKHLQTIIETAKEHNIQYIVYDQIPSTKVIETVQKETGTKPVTLHNLEYVTQDDISNKEDYLGIMNQNVETLKTILSK